MAAAHRCSPLSGRNRYACMSQTIVGTLTLAFDSLGCLSCSNYGGELSTIAVNITATYRIHGSYSSEHNRNISDLQQLTQPAKLQHIGFIEANAVNVTATYRMHGSYRSERNRNISVLQKLNYLAKGIQTGPYGVHDPKRPDPLWAPQGSSRPPLGGMHAQAFSLNQTQ